MTRKQISELLIKWNMPTRQAFISEVLQLHLEGIKEVEEKFNQRSYLLGYADAKANRDKLNNPRKEEEVK